MHPPLYRPHPLCEQYVTALVLCHEDHKIGKWFGACNDAKYAMDRCFREEKEQRRKVNMDKARAFDEKYEEFLKRKESNGKQA